MPMQPPARAIPRRLAGADQRLIDGKRRARRGERWCGGAMSVLPWVHVAVGSRGARRRKWSLVIPVRHRVGRAVTLGQGKDRAKSARICAGCVWTRGRTVAMGRRRDPALFAAAWDRVSPGWPSLHMSAPLECSRPWPATQQEPHLNVRRELPRCTAGRGGRPVRGGLGRMRFVNDRRSGG